MTANLNLVLKSGLRMKSFLQFALDCTDAMLRKPAIVMRQFGNNFLSQVH